MSDKYYKIDQQKKAQIKMHKLFDAARQVIFTKKYTEKTNNITCNNIICLKNENYELQKDYNILQTDYMNLLQKYNNLNIKYMQEISETTSNFETDLRMSAILCDKFYM